MLVTIQSVNRLLCNPFIFEGDRLMRNSTLSNGKEVSLLLTSMCLGPIDLLTRCVCVVYVAEILRHLVSSLFVSIARQPPSKRVCASR